LEGLGLEKEKGFPKWKILELIQIAERSQGIKKVQVKKPKGGKIVMDTLKVENGIHRLVRISPLIPMQNDIHLSLLVMVIS